MPAIRRKAPASTEDDVSTPPSTQNRRNRRQEDTPDDDDEVDEVGEEEHGSGSVAQLSKALVRYALACEYSRIPIKRQDVGQKVLGTHTRKFKAVFDAANSQLMDIFGMQLEELPNKGKHTMRQKRAAAASEGAPKSSNTYVLKNILPDEYRTRNIIGPGPEPPENEVDMEAAYSGFYTVIISLILLSGGSLSEGKLDRFLRRMNADRTTPVDNTEKVIARMVKEGYLEKVKETSGGEEIIDYMVGPRGKVEVGKEGVANLVRALYGDVTEDIEQRLKRSLGLEYGDVEES
ncbi:MAGE-domain-containing protein [Byssothecium circinans]|uniref:MAGE-domain-containing protein n=1 Tax=Byssothecium circinans TaxID=147558 RepID=A0A6A5U2G5_9PLEO|nr:MAGE-domain-containing protein [Byssothecium circinans]